MKPYELNVDWRDFLERVSQLQEAISVKEVTLKHAGIHTMSGCSYTTTLRDSNGSGFSIHTCPSAYLCHFGDLVLEVVIGNGEYYSKRLFSEIVRVRLCAAKKISHDSWQREKDRFKEYAELASMTILRISDGKEYNFERELILNRGQEIEAFHQIKSRLTGESAMQFMSYCSALFAIKFSRFPDEIRL